MGHPPLFRGPETFHETLVMPGSRFKSLWDVEREELVEDAIAAVRRTLSRSVGFGFDVIRGGGDFCEVLKNGLWFVTNRYSHTYYPVEIFFFRSQSPPPPTSFHFTPTSHARGGGESSIFPKFEKKHTAQQQKLFRKIFFFKHLISRFIIFLRE